MHNRTIVDGAFAAAGVSGDPGHGDQFHPHTGLAVLEGQVCSVVPGAVLGAVMAWRELEALALVEPELQTPVGFMLVRAARHSHTVEAALALARDPGLAAACGAPQRSPARLTRWPSFNN
jgi:hypothetical protein